MFYSIQFFRYDERDVSLSREQLLDLKERLGTPKFAKGYLPQVFINGQLLGVSEIHHIQLWETIDQNLGHLSDRASQ